MRFFVPNHKPPPLEMAGGSAVPARSVQSAASEK